MAKGRACPRGFVCTDNSTIWLTVFIILVGFGAAVYFIPRDQPPVVYRVTSKTEEAPSRQMVQPDIYAEPVQRYGLPGIPALASRYPSVGPVQQIGILTAEGGSSSSAAPDRTILPLFGRELDARRSRWNYYTRTDGSNPVQVPVRVGNRVCDDDTNGCNEVYSDDAVHVPALGRSFKATVYRKTLF